ncbi:MAG: hypothetical protein OEY64_04810 [Nitrospinota bacterium]|nr:hypothetical protein [Nitrospinota bacterium]
MRYSAVALLMMLGWLVPYTAPAGAEGNTDFETFELGEDFEIDETSTEPLLSKDLRFTISAGGGMPPQGSASEGSYRFDLRTQWGRYFDNGLFFSLDAKGVIGNSESRFIDNRDVAAGSLRLRDLYIQKGADCWSLKAGYQVIVWGELDMVQITDVVTPWDYSEFAFTAPEDARVGQAIVLYEFYKALGGTAGIFINPIPLTNRYPGGDARNLFAKSFGSTSFILEENKPGSFGNNAEFGFKWKKNAGIMDLSFMGASLYADDAVYTFKGTAPEPVFTSEYPKFVVGGAAVNIRAENLLWKVEVAHKEREGVPSGSEKIVSDEAGLGVDVNIRDIYSLVFETSVRQGSDGDTSIYAARGSRSFRNETLNAVIFLSYDTNSEYLVKALYFRYSVSDNISAEFSGTVMDVGKEDSPMKFVDSMDVVTLRVNYYF